MSSDDDRIEVARADITDSASVRTAMKGCDDVVHASSTVALARPGRVRASGPRAPRGEAPPTIVSPGGVIGPHDPYLGESNDVIVQILRGQLPVFPRGRLDVSAS